jgi:putative transposase
LPPDEIAREGARRMLIEALRAEADDYIERHRGERGQQGRALAVRNGLAQGRKLTLGTGTVALKAPRIDDRRRDEQGGRRRFTIRLLPLYMRRSPKVAEVLPPPVSARALDRRFSHRAGRVARRRRSRSVADQHRPTYRLL